MEKFGTIHTVLSNAGMHNENLLAESFDSAGKLEAPSMRCLDINLTAHFYVTKLALYHFKAGPSSNHQIVYTASAASYIETPPLYQYGAAKSGLLGLMRALRPVTQRWNVTVNIVTPWMTRKFSPKTSISAKLTWNLVTPMMGGEDMTPSASALSRLLIDSISRICAVAPIPADTRVNSQ